MALVYNFAFPSPAAGETVTVTDDGGTEVGSGDLGSTVGTDGAITLQVSLPEGGYIGTVEGSFGTWTTRGLLDVPDSIEDQPGASETAYLIATGPVYTTDGNGTEGNLNFEADTRQGDLPSWASITGGDIALSAEAGTCAFSIAAEFEFDFTAASGVADAPGQLGSGGIVVKVDGTTILNLPNDTIDGDGQNVQTSPTQRGGNTVVGALVTAQPFPLASDDAEVNIPDGAATPRVAFTITRLAPAPVLPA